jgi:hypothetical protein
MADGRSASGAELLARVRREIDERLAALRPAADEYQQLLGAFDALESSAAEPEQPASVAAPAKPRRAAAKPPRAPAAAPRSAPAAKPARTPAKPRRTPAKPREQALGAPELAIVAALEHGSHTVAELGVVTAMSGGEIRDGARRLLRAGRIVRASREGRSAYALLGKE